MYKILKYMWLMKWTFSRIKEIISAIARTEFELRNDEKSRQVFVEF